MANAAESIWLEVSAAHDVDPIILYAIALQESRQLRPDGLLRPWPWTLHVAGQGAMRFDNYQQAADKLIEVLESGVTNVDIGMMQINWRWNGHLLPEPTQILIPENNIRLGATILRRELDKGRGDLSIAIGRYHNSAESLGGPYAISVLSIADSLRRTRGLYLALTL